MSGGEDPRVQDFLRRYPEFFGQKLKRETHQKGGPQWVVDCPLCRKKGHFYMSAETSQWDCKACGERGNLQSLRKTLGIAPAELNRLGEGGGEQGVRARVRLGGKGGEEKGKPAARPLRSEDVDAAHARLLARNDQAALLAWEWLVDERCFTPKVIEEFRLGVDEQDCPGDDAVRAAVEGGRVRTSGRGALGGAPSAQVVANLHTKHGGGHEGRCEVCGGNPRIAYVTVPSYEAGRLVGLKRRAIPPWPKAWLRHPGCKSTLFHVDALSLEPDEEGAVPPVVLVEGEWDVVAMRCMGWKNVISVPTGASGHLQDGWTEQLAAVEQFFVCYDADDAGHLGAERIATELGRHRCWMVTYPAGDPEKCAACPCSTARGGKCSGDRCKDANDVLKAGRTEDMLAAFDCADDWRPSVIVPSENYFEAVWRNMRQPEVRLGMRTGWEALDALWGGCRPAELTVITGHSGAGKTTWTQALGRNLAKGGYPGLVLPAETKTLGGVEQYLLMEAGQTVGKRLHECDRAEFDRLCARVRQMPVWWLDHYGEIATSVLQETVYYAAMRLGIRWVLLDHLGFFAQPEDGESEWDAYTRLVRRQLLRWSDELKLHVLLVAHPKVVDGADETTRIQMCNLKGGSALWQDVHTVIAVHRYRTKTRQPGKAEREAPTGRSPAGVVILKCRGRSGSEGEVVLDLDPGTCVYYDP